MKRLRLLSHEIGTECNLAAEHAAKCPMSVDRYENVNTSRILGDDLIVSNVEYVYSLGFTGFLAWQYYCEPLLFIDRIEGLFEKIKKVVPEAKHLLWTNGVLIDREVDAARLKFFSSIIISGYEQRDWSKTIQTLPQINLIRGRLDKRLRVCEFSRNRCYRPCGEMIVDFYGNHRLCCGDYKGTASDLNVYTDGFAALVDRHLYFRDMLEIEPLSDLAPKICFTCCIRKG